MHERLPAIASCHAHYESIPEMAEETAEWLSTGLQGLKTGFGKRGNARLGYDHDRDVAYVKAMREVLGDKMLMIDNGIDIKWDVTDAVRRAKAMEEYNLAWIEEPLGAWDPEGYANLRAKTTTRIAYGEREWTLEQFERVLATGTVDVVGVDPGRAEGITGFKKVTRALRVLPPPGQRACLVVGDRHRGQPRHLVQLAGLQAVRVQAAAQSDAARPGDEAVRARGRLGLPADRAGARHRGDRGGRRGLSQREGAGAG